MTPRTPEQQRTLDRLRKLEKLKAWEQEGAEAIVNMAEQHASSMNRQTHNREDM